MKTSSPCSTHSQLSLQLIMFLMPKSFLLLLDGLFSNLSVYCCIIFFSYFVMVFVFNVLGLHQISDILPEKLHICFS